MSVSVASLVTDDLRASYERDGAVKVEGVFEQSWLDLLATGIEKDIAEPGPLHTIQQSGEDLGYFLTDFCMAQRLEEFRSFVTGSQAAELAACIMDASRISFFYDAIWVKGTRTPKRSRWHQDQPYYSVDGHQFCAIWLALEALEKDVCLELLKGSHRWGRLFKAVTPNYDPYMLDSSYEDLPDIDGHRGDYELFCPDMEPGDILLFNAQVVHGSSANYSTDRPRRAFASRWCDDTIVFESRHATMPLLWDHGLTDGDRLAGSLFPQVLPEPIPNEGARRAEGPEPPPPEVVQRVMADVARRMAATQ